MQFQNFSISIYSSRYDLTCFILLLLVFFLMIFGKRNTYISFALLTFFFLQQILLWLYVGETPYHRLLSGLVWLGGLLSLAIFSRKMSYNKNMAYKLITFVAISLATVIYFQYLVMNYDRPSGFFDEPSAAGLVLAAAAGMFLFRVAYLRKFGSKISYRDILFFLISLVGLMLTGSMHLLTFLLAAAVIVFLFGIAQNFGVTGIVLSSFLFGSFVMTRNAHYSDRLVIGDTSNVSLLAWLQGFEQAREAMTTSPIFGYGVGATGFFNANFDSPSGEQLFLLGLGDLNLLDGYSGFFRLAIETGLFGLLVVAFYLLCRLKVLWRICSAELNLMRSVQYSACLLIFGLILMLGILIKEPTYSRSYVYIAILLLSTNYLPLLRIAQNSTVN
jgi:hypothetical protein